MRTIALLVAFLAFLPSAAALDNAKNFAKATVSTAYSETQTNIALLPGHASLLPTPPFNAIWWNSIYADPADDQSREIVRVNTITNDTVYVSRGQEDTAARTHATPGATYNLRAEVTAKVFNTDIPALLSGGGGGSGLTNVFSSQFTAVNGTNINLAASLIVTNLQSDNQIRLGTNGAGDIFLVREENNTLAQRNGTTAQTNYIYNTWTDATSWERAVSQWNANTFEFGTEKGSVGGTDRQLTFKTGGSNRWTINTSGNLIPVANNVNTIGTTSFGLKSLWFAKTITAAGTTGAQTINRSAGSVNFAAAAQTLVVTCNVADANSVIMATVATDDATATSCKAIPASGSFTLKLNAAATAETRVQFIVVN